MDVEVFIKYIVSTSTGCMGAGYYREMSIKRWGLKTFDCGKNGPLGEASKSREGLDFER